MNLRTTLYIHQTAANKVVNGTPTPLRFVAARYHWRSAQKSMPQTLYLLKDEELFQTTGNSAICYGVKPSGKGSYDDFHNLSRKISLKNDLGWREVENLQKLFRQAEIWENFPAEGLKFIFAELRAGDEDQRIDLLYLRDDGGLYPCELKIGGDSLDTHGQLLRYIADLHFQNIDSDWLIDRRRRYLTNKGVTGNMDQTIEIEKLKGYLTEKGIEDKHLHLLRNSGIIVDEAFKPQMLKAVRYLNEESAFSIRLLRMDAFAADDWDVSAPEFRVRIDITEIQ